MESDILNALIVQTQTLNQIYIVLLFMVGVSCAVFVCFLLYKFLKLCF